MQENFIAGLVSGLVVTLFVVVFKKVWDAILVPWFEERVYKDVQIEGKWYGLYPNTVDLSQDIIVLERQGHAIKGKLICTHGADEGNEFNLQGSFRNMLLPLTYEIKDTSKTDRGTITLKAINNGVELIGKIALYNDALDEITTANIHWFRSKENLEKMKELVSDQKEEIIRLEAERKIIEKKVTEISSSSSEKDANKSTQPAADASTD